MPRIEKQVSPATKRFHELIEHGSVEGLKDSLAIGAPVNEPGRIGMTSLMVAIDAKDVAKMKLLIEHGADAVLTDDFNSTALLHAVHADFIDGVRFLLSLGVDRGLHPKYALKKIDFEIDSDVPMPEELKTVMSEDEWKESLDETINGPAEMDSTPIVRPTISEVESLAVLKLFLDAGDDLSLASDDMKREFIGLGRKESFQSTVNDYNQYRSPRYGKRNPDRMDNVFWGDMIRNGGNAYSAKKQFHDSILDGPVWCYDRFGASLTPLQDGRFVQIGGEHEDFYDPDFYIYNDVVVHDGKGGFDIFGYPKDIFPPTDFHTATLVEDSIYIVGCLGYKDQRREGFTPVLKLKLGTWEIESIQTTGAMPGWIHSHSARYDRDKNVIAISGGEYQILADNGRSEFQRNDDKFELDLSTHEWRKVQ